MITPQSSEEKEEYRTTVHQATEIEGAADGNVEFACFRPILRGLSILTAAL